VSERPLGWGAAAQAATGNGDGELRDCCRDGSGSGFGCRDGDAVCGVIGGAKGDAATRDWRSRREGASVARQADG